MTDIKLLLLHNNTWNQLNVHKKSQAHFKMLSTKRLGKSYI